MPWYIEASTDAYSTRAKQRGDIGMFVFARLDFYEWPLDYPLP